MLDPFNDPDESWRPWGYPDAQGCVEGLFAFAVFVILLSLLLHP